MWSLGKAPERKAEDQLEYLWLAAAVFSGLCLLACAVVIVSPRRLEHRPETIGVLAGLTLAFGAAFRGLRGRRRWGWWLSLSMALMLALPAAVGTLLFYAARLFSVQLSDHGVGAAGERILSAILPVLASIGGGFAWSLYRIRSLFQQATIATWRAGRGGDPG